MKIKTLIWAEVSEEEFNKITSTKEELEFIINNMIDYDTSTDISRTEWEEDGLDWSE